MKTNEDVLGMIYKVRDEQLFEVTESKRVITLIKQDKFAQRLFRKLGKYIPEYKRTELDALGSFVFLHLDGVRTVEEVGILVEQEFGEDEYLYERLLLFLNHIHVNEEYITIVEEVGEKPS